MCKIDGTRANQYPDKLNSTSKVDRSNQDVPVPPAEKDDHNSDSPFGPDDKNEINHYNDDDKKVIKNLNLCSNEPEEPGIYQCTAKTDPDEPGIYQCTAKIDPDNKEDNPKIFECTAKIGPEPKEHLPGIYQCISKIKPIHFEEIKQKPTDIKDLFKTKDDKLDVRDGRARDDFFKPKEDNLSFSEIRTRKEQEPGYGNHQDKAEMRKMELEQDKKDIKQYFKNDMDKLIEKSLKETTSKDYNPGIYNCTYKTDPDKKDDKGGIYNCTFKFDPDKKHDKPEIYNCTYKLDMGEDL